MNGYRYLLNLDKYTETNYLAPQELAFLQALIMFANKVGFDESKYTPRNTWIMQKTGFSSRVVLNRWRDSLVKKGLITFEARHKQAGLYGFTEIITGEVVANKPVETKTEQSVIEDKREVATTKPTNPNDKIIRQVRPVYSLQSLRRFKEWDSLIKQGFLPMHKVKNDDRASLKKLFSAIVSDKRAKNLLERLSWTNWDGIFSPSLYIRTCIVAELNQEKSVVQME